MLSAATVSTGDLSPSNIKAEAMASIILQLSNSVSYHNSFYKSLTAVNAHVLQYNGF